MSKCLNGRLPIAERHPSAERAAPVHSLFLSPRNRAPTDSGCTPLFMVSQNGHTEVVGRLLARDNIDVNKAREDGGDTPLIDAVKHADPAIVKMVAGLSSVNVNQSNDVGDTPLDIAINSHDHRKIKLFLVEYVKWKKYQGNDEIGKTEEMMEVV